MGSLAGGLARKVEEALTIPLVKNLVDDIMVVSEESIEYVIVYAWSRCQQVIEGSAAVTLAAILEGLVSLQPAILVISGGNVQAEMRRDLVRKWSSENLHK
jgi:threonine dehydratase